jgi:hypothetical protein
VIQVIGKASLKRRNDAKGVAPQAKRERSTDQACTACSDARTPKVTVLQLPTTQCRALRYTQCQLLIVYCSI